jgi:hypothetical protein
LNFYLDLSSSLENSSTVLSTVKTFLKRSPTFTKRKRKVTEARENDQRSLYHKVHKGN